MNQTKNKAAKATDQQQLDQALEHIYQASCLVSKVLDKVDRDTTIVILRHLALAGDEIHTKALPAVQAAEQATNEVLARVMAADA